MHYLARNLRKKPSKLQQSWILFLALITSALPLRVGAEQTPPMTATTNANSSVMAVDKTKDNKDTEAVVSSELEIKEEPYIPEDTVLILETTIQNYTDDD